MWKRIRTLTKKAIGLDITITVAVCLAGVLLAIYFGIRELYHDNPNEGIRYLGEAAWTIAIFVFIYAIYRGVLRSNQTLRKQRQDQKRASLDEKNRTRR